MRANSLGVQEILPEKMMPSLKNNSSYLEKLSHRQRNHMCKSPKAGGRSPVQLELKDYGE